MYQIQAKLVQHDLLGSLLEQSDDQTFMQQNTKINNRIQSSSAPPNFIHCQEKIDFSVLQSTTFDSLDPEDQCIVEAFTKRANYMTRSFQWDHPAPTELQGYRKMSEQSKFTHQLENQEQEQENFQIEYYNYAEQENCENQKSLSKIYYWARDQNGSRIVQDIFQGNSQEQKDIFFDALFKYFKILVIDRFGNYVLQKIFEKGSNYHKKELMNFLWGSITQISMNSFGCRVIQKSIQQIQNQPENQKRFIDEISHSTFDLIENKNGNHVIQKCFQVFSHSIVSPLVDVLYQNVNQIVTQLQYFTYHIYGCRVIQKYLENYCSSQKRKQILNFLLKLSISLSKCQFGNYVMQYIVTKCKKQRQKVFQQFIQNILQLCTNKYASNVMQKAINAQDSNFSSQLSEYFINNQKSFIFLAKHQFGNYVVQSLVSKSNLSHKNLLKSILRQNSIQISKTPNGRHVLLQI